MAHDMAHEQRPLAATAAAMVRPGRGILAADESVGTMSSRLEAAGIPASAESRRRWRELIITTPGLSEWISGVILCDETFRQAATDGAPLPEAAARAGILAGIKVDTGAKPLAGHDGETVTEGLDGLADRLAEYAEMGAAFAKWRGVLTIGDGLPSAACTAANAHALARYAALCQAAGIVPIVEPEVMMTGGHGAAVCEAVTTAMLREVFAELVAQDVALEGIVLKPNMVLPGIDGPAPDSVAEVAEATLRALRRSVPPAVPGVAFLSGGQPDGPATAHLDALNRRGPHPWELTFSYGRGLVATPLEAWDGTQATVAVAQSELAHRARCNAAARDGAYDESVEADRRPLVGG
jgi:fructose-bisphosphate aldolase class I